MEWRETAPQATSRPMNVAIIGAGKVGSTLAQALRGKGHEEKLGVRSPDANAGTVAIAAAVAPAQVVVLATPFAAREEVVRAAGSLAGKVVIDATNPLGPGLALAVGHGDSGAEVLQRLAPDARVVKCFNTVGVEVMANPVFHGRRATMFLCGDDAQARQTAATLASDLGFEPVDLGPLKHARLLEPAAALWIHLAVVERRGRRMALRLEAEGPRAATPGPSSPVHAIAVLGAGHIGGGLARAWAKAGHRVVFGVRTPGDAEVQALAQELGATVASPAEAVAASHVVALAVPAQAVEALLPSLSLAGKVLIDCTNHVAPGFSLTFGHTTSWAEEIARKVPGARVFKSFNAQGAENLAAPVYADGPAANFFCGDDPAARAIVEQLVGDVGFEPVSAGPLSNARLLEPLMLLWVTAARVLGRRAVGFRLLRD